MSIIDYLYKGAAPGERVATQKAVQNMPYGQIGKNILAEGGFGTGSNNRGYDPNFKGKGALPSNTALQKYVTGPYNYIKGGVSSIFGGNAAGNIGGGTPAQRQLFEKVASSPFSKTMGTAAKTALSASMTAGPTGAYAMYQMNKPSTPAGYDYVRDYDMGSITNAADAENALDYQNFSTGMMNADKNYPGITGVNLEEEEFNPTQYLASNDIAMRNARLAPNDSRFSGIMRNVARGPLFQGGAMAGNAIGSALGMANPLFALAGGIGSQFLNLSNRPSDLDYDYVNQPGGVSVVDNKVRGGVLEGKNFASGYGSNNLGTMYQNYIDTMKGRGMVEDEFGNLVFDEDELTDAQGIKLSDAQKQLNAYLSTGRKMSGYETPEGKRMTDREFAFNYNQGIGQFAMPTTDSTGKTLDYTGESDTYAGGMDTKTGNYDDPYSPGDAD
jgi:hypothetical protein|tara:strand:- start:4 stop:1329 length:1326 start_codon:yes stop_codon:yes gene_type:complete